MKNCDSTSLPSRHRFPPMLVSVCGHCSVLSTGFVPHVIVGTSVLYNLKESWSQVIITHRLHIIIIPKGIRNNTPPKFPRQSDSSRFCSRRNTPTTLGAVAMLPILHVQLRFASHPAERVLSRSIRTRSADPVHGAPVIFCTLPVFTTGCKATLVFDFSSGRLWSEAVAGRLTRVRRQPGLRNHYRGLHEWSDRPQSARPVRRRTLVVTAVPYICLWPPVR